MDNQRRNFKWRLGVIWCAVTFISLPAVAQIDLGEVRPTVRPAPPPPSAYLSEEDYFYLDAAFEAARIDDWNEALDLSVQVTDEVGRDLVRWLWAQDNESDAPFGAIVDFMNQHPDWPRQETLLRRAEEAMPRTMAPDQIIAWFAGNEPVSGFGKLRLADAYLAHGNRQFARHWIRRAWVEHDFTSSEERALLVDYGSHLDDASHIARAERLLWAHQYSPARRMRSYVTPEFRLLMDAWLALMTLDSSASNHVGRVPVAYQGHPGLLYERIRWRRRKGRDEDTWPMLIEAPTTTEALVEPERWWVERHIQARNALREGDPQSAYDMVRGHGIPAGGDFAEAEWLAGFIALRFLDRPNDAYDHFVRLSEGVSYPISLARAYYWMGRAAEELERAEDAVAHYLSAAEHPTTYYGQLAMERLPEPRPLALPQGPTPSDARRAMVRSDPLVHGAELLSAVASERLQFSWFLHLGGSYTEPEDLQIIADLAREIDQWHMAVRVGKLAMFRHIYLTETTYPLIDYEDFEADIPLPEMALVLGLSRQESEFNPRARSSAGARGLMQLMPATARATARNLRVEYNTNWLTEFPAYNTELGRYHFGELLARFDGSYIMSIAAYNAGAHRVDRWVSEFGDPRSGAIDPVDWVELISFRETRNYVQRVMENTMVYRNRLTGADLEVTMTADLARARGQAPIMFASIPEPTIAAAPNATTTQYASHLSALVSGLSTSLRGPEIAAEVPTNSRVVLTLSGDDVAITTQAIGSEDTLDEPNVRVWTIPEGCTAYVLEASGDTEGSCEQSSGGF